MLFCTVRGRGRSSISPAFECTDLDESRRRRTVPVAPKIPRSASPLRFLTRVGAYKGMRSWLKPQVRTTEAHPAHRPSSCGALERGRFAREKDRSALVFEVPVSSRMGPRRYFGQAHYPRVGGEPHAGPEASTKEVSEDRPDGAGPAVGAQHIHTLGPSLANFSGHGAWAWAMCHPWPEIEI